MKKTDKKTEKMICMALTQVCDTALESVDDFVWITHMVNYSSLASSLNVVCVFKTDDGLSRAYQSKQHEYLYQLINDQLNRVNIKLSRLDKQVHFDTEEACQRSHAGKWKERLTKFSAQHLRQHLNKPTLH